MQALLTPEPPEPHVYLQRIAPQPEPPAPAIGSIVLYVLPDGCNAGQDRPAIVVRAWETTSNVNLQIFTDGPNDGDRYEWGLAWATSVPYSAEVRPGTWHWSSHSQASTAQHQLL